MLPSLKCHLLIQFIMLKGLHFIFFTLATEIVVSFIVMNIILMVKFLIGRNCV